ncbi:MAG: pyrroloquinoline quinone biosynthesis protein PqqE [Hyphomicrobiales bacterium]|nr:pyrroloquinoline quinone biosynthesis protein PqqE [Hyphomicrobiales bacterium]
MNAPFPPPPIGLLVELTHRCPLGCPYCSNPVALDRPGVELDTDAWRRVFAEAQALGVLHVHLSGGEPTARRDIVELTRATAEHRLYSNLITSGIGVGEKLWGELVEAGLDHAQLSFQGADKETNDRIGHYDGAWERKLAFARMVTKSDLPLTLNAVIHRANLHQVGAFIELAVELGARRLEVAHTQYYGWGLVNRAALMPPKDEVMQSIALVEAARARLKGTLVIDMVVPDYYARYPKPCAGAWGRVAINISPSGKALPCHAAETIGGLEFWNVRERSLSEIWRDNPAFNAFRGTAWMPEPCRSCERREIDWGGCRCQALALTGDAAATDPACFKSSDHDRVAAIAAGEAEAAGKEMRWRSFRVSPTKVAAQ